MPFCLLFPPPIRCIPVGASLPGGACEPLLQTNSIADSSSTSIRVWNTLTMDEAKGQQPSPATTNPSQEVPPRSDIDEILRRKRKAREYKVRTALFCPSGAAGQAGCGFASKRRSFVAGNMRCELAIWTSAAPSSLGCGSGSPCGSGCAVGCRRPSTLCCKHRAWLMLIVRLI